MAKEYVVIEDDRCYVDTPVFTWRGDCCNFKRQLIMTKEIFQECYKKWILEEQKQRTGHWIGDAIQGEIDGQIVKGFTCSKCGAISLFRMTGGKIVNGDLCPNCNAKMQEVEG